MQAVQLQGLEQLRSLSVQLPQEGDAAALERQLQQLSLALEVQGLVASRQQAQRRTPLAP